MDEIMSNVKTGEQSANTAASAQEKSSEQLNLEKQLAEQFGDLNGIDLSSIDMSELNTQMTDEELQAELAALENEGNEAEPTPEEVESEEERTSKRRKKLASLIELNVSKDSMIAYLRIKKPAAPQNGEQAGEEEPFEVFPEDIISFLESRDIKFGLREEAIREFCEKRKFYSELKCAIGKEPVHQDPAEIKFEFETEKNIKPKENEDGTVDFKNLGLIQTVTEGQVLCRVLVPPEGKNGMDVYGNEVPYKPCKIPQLPSGQNTIVSEDRLTLTSAVDGSVEYIRNKVEVQPVFIVRGNVDNSSGDIDFFGSVTVDGDVREGFTVKAGKEVIVKGIVEGAFIEAGEDVKLLKGMNGMGKGTIKAGGDISGKFFENAILQCDGDLYSDSLLNCKVQAGNSVHLKGSRSVLVGGECKAGSAIVGYNIGSASGIKTVVSVGLNAAEKGEELEANLSRQGELRIELDRVLKTMEDLQAKLTVFKEKLAKKMQSENDTAIFKVLLMQKSKHAAYIAQLNKELEELKSKQVDYDFSDLKVVGKKIVYPGVKIVIGPFTMFVDQEYSASKFYAGEEKIEFTTASASDAD